MVNKRKLRQLEGMVLPDRPEPATIYITDEREVTLSNKAQKIRKRIEAGTANILQNESLTLEQKIEKGQKIYAGLDIIEQNILTKDTDFMRHRLRSILEGYYTPMFPKNNTAVRLRIVWFLREMDKLGYYEQMEESEFNYHRNEDDPDFEDLAWWKNFDSKVKKEFPDGIFSKKSYTKLRVWFDTEESKFIGKYYKEHPEEFERLTKKLENAQKKLGKN